MYRYFSLYKIFIVFTKIVTFQRTAVIVAIACAVIVSIGLGVGLGVGLSNQNKGSDGQSKFSFCLKQFLELNSIILQVFQV